MDKVGPFLRAKDLVAVIGRSVPVRLINISESGCLLQADRQIPSGKTVTLRVTVEGREYKDDIRIVRCHAMHGSGGWWQIGAEFLWTALPGERSLRRLVSRLHEQKRTVKSDRRRKTKHD